MRLWFCTHCGVTYAHTPDGNTQWYAGAGCCSQCPPWFGQSPGMAEYGPNLSFDVAILHQQLIGEIIHFERLHNVIIPTI